jgi:hypothetical protein
LLRAARRISRQIVQEQLDGPAPAHQLWRLVGLLFGEDFQQFHHQTVHRHCKTRDHSGFRPPEHAVADVPENLPDPRIAQPHGLFAVTQFPREFREVTRR